MIGAGPKFQNDERVSRSLRTGRDAACPAPRSRRWRPASLALGRAAGRLHPAFLRAGSMRTGAERRHARRQRAPRRALPSTTASRNRNSGIASRPRAKALSSAPISRPGASRKAMVKATRRPTDRLTPRPAAQPAPYRVASLAPQLPFQRPPRGDETMLVSLKSSAFPYFGNNPRTEEPFLNVSSGSRHGHRGMGGRVFWQDETFNDNRVLMHVPENFDINKPGVIVVFFHGNGATLERDVRDRQRVPQQISDSGVNAVLLAPQLAVDAADSSAGKFWQPGGLKRFVSGVGRSSREPLWRSAHRQNLRQHAGRSSSATAAASCRRPGAWKSAASAIACAACSCSTRCMASSTSSPPGSRTIAPASSSAPTPTTPRLATTN